MTDGRARAQRLLRGEPATLSVPLALRPAARIQERDWETFLRDATQLANGLRDLVEGIQPTGLAVTTPEVVAADPGEPTARTTVTTALEATTRLRTSLGERVALVACLPGPAALPGGDADVQALGKAFLQAGVDVLAVLDDHDPGSSLGTLANIARFHQALAVGCCDQQGLPTTVTRVPLEEPGPTPGIAITDPLPADTDMSTLIDWVRVVEGA